jgi:hypothetical protein
VPEVNFVIFVKALKRTASFFVWFGESLRLMEKTDSKREEKWEEIQNKTEKNKKTQRTEEDVCVEEQSPQKRARKSLPHSIRAAVAGETQNTPTPKKSLPSATGVKKIEKNKKTKRTEEDVCV